MAQADLVRLIPDCRVKIDGQALDAEKLGRLARVVVDLDAELFGSCALVFNDPEMKLINGKVFDSGVRVQVEMGFASKMTPVFDGEIVALEPQFRRDKPPALQVVCFESLHRLALSTMTRALNDVDDAQAATKIAQEHGLTADAPSGTTGHSMQANVTDAG